MENFYSNIFIFLEKKRWIQMILNLQKKIILLMTVVSISLCSISPASAAKPINCGKPKFNGKQGIVTNSSCNDSTPNLGVKTFLQKESPRVMSFSKKPTQSKMLDAVCSDLQAATSRFYSQLNIVIAVGYQALAFDSLNDQQYMTLLTVLMSESDRATFENKFCIGGKFVLPDTSMVSEEEKKAKELVKKNTELQDSCYFTRTINGTDAYYARQLCVARYPNSLQWARSTNHNAEELCYFTRTTNGDDEINARNICLAKYPIRN